MILMNDKAAGWKKPARLRCRARSFSAAGLFRRYREIRKGKTDATSPEGKPGTSPAQAPMARHMEVFDGESKAILAAVQQGGSEAEQSLENHENRRRP
jgi:hypothetical protein